MFLSKLFLCTLVAPLLIVSGTFEIASESKAVSNKTANEGPSYKAPEAKSYGVGYGYTGQRSYGSSYGGGNYGGHGRNYGQSSRYGHGNYNRHNQHVPIQIPFINGQGCTKVGDVVCNEDAEAGSGADMTLCSYLTCVLSDESTNLWKRPSITTVESTCPTGRGVLSTFCNNNEILLRAIGFTRKGHQDNKAHPKKYVISKDPCVVVNTACA